MCQARDNNIAMFGKLGWHFVENSDKLCAQLMRQKKLHSDNMFTHLLPLSASTIWKSICRAIPFVREGYKWRIGYGQQVSVWFDRWVGDFPLYSLIPHPEEEDKSLMVAELISYLVIVKKKKNSNFCSQSKLNITSLLYVN